MSVKAALRHTVKARLRQMPPALRAAESQRVLAELERHPAFQTARTVMLYHSLPDEVQTHAFLARLAAAKTVLLPVVVGGDLQVRRFTTSAGLATGAFGIGEPAGEPFTNLEQIDLIVVPGVAFDAAGRRMGRGRGYYDRFLSQPSLSRACRIGICYACQFLPEVPSEPHDVPMHAVIHG